jgi:hypothetical protein
MKLRVFDKRYDYNASMNEGTLGDWRDLKRETGIGRLTMEKALLRLDAAGTFDIVFDDAEILDSIIALAWLCCRHGGDPISFEQAEALTFSDVQFVADEEPAPDPTQASGDQTPPSPETVSVPKPNARKRSATTSKT